MSPPKTSQLFIFFFLFFLHFETSSSSNRSTLCPISYCTGGDTPIKYPFWLADDDHHPTSDHYCGYPGFGLSCSNGKPVISISDDVFYVEDMDYDKSTVTLVDTDVVNQTCPRVKHNLTLATLPLDSKSDININLSFYFNCTTNSFLGSLLSNSIQLSCLGQDKLSSYVIEEAVDMPTWWGSCEDNVMVAVRRDAVPSNYSDLISRWSDALQEGFVLDWRTVSDCGKCEASDGYCGFNETTKETICFCEDGDIASGPNLCKGKHSKTKAIIGVVSGAAGALLLTFLVWIIYQQRKKRKYGPSSYVSRSISSYPSSRSDVEKGSRYMGVHVFTYTELVDATNNFDEKKELGDGGFGTVYYGKLKDGREVAVKRLYENNYRRVEQFMNEVDILTRLHHKNLVILYGCTSRHSRELLLVYEYIENGTVADHLHGVKARPGSLPWPLRLNIAVETARALTYLHASDIIHRDVKTNNILMDKNFCVKVADFGLSRLFPMDVTHVSTAPQGTPGYVDPEYHQCYQLTDKSDVYSFGVVLAELISSLPAVDITRHRHEINLSNMAINKIQSQSLHEFVDPSLGFSSDETVRKSISAVAELAFQCLQSAKELRPTMDEVLETLTMLQTGKRNPDQSPDKDTTSDDVGLLKYGVASPLSPVSVTAKWSSSSGATTPNTSC